MKTKSGLKKKNAHGRTLRHTCELEDEAFLFPIDAANNRANPHPPLEKGGEVIRDSLVCADVRQRHQPTNGGGQGHEHPVLGHFCHYPPDRPTKQAEHRRAGGAKYEALRFGHNGE